MKLTIAVSMLTVCLAGLGACAPDDEDGTMGRPDASPLGDRIDAGFRVPQTGDGGLRDGGSSNTPTPDPDGPTTPVAYRRTEPIDGINGFTVNESFPTTTGGFGAFITYDDQNIYVGYSGTDIDSGSDTIWVQVFFDVDPGSGNGATTGEVYNTLQPGMPTGFGADYYFRWLANEATIDVRQFSGGVWGASTAAPVTVKSGTFVETSIALADLGNPTRLGVTALIVKETPFAEFSFAGLYEGNFVDNYYGVDTSPIPLTKFAEFDFTSANVPVSPANQRP